MNVLPLSRSTSLERVIPRLTSSVSPFLVQNPSLNDGEEQLLSPSIYLSSETSECLSTRFDDSPKENATCVRKELESKSQQETFKIFEKCLDSILQKRDRQELPVEILSELSGSGAKDRMKDTPRPALKKVSRVPPSSISPIGCISLNLEAESSANLHSLTPNMAKSFTAQLSTIRNHWRGTKVNLPAVFTKLVEIEGDVNIVQDLSSKLLYPNQVFASAAEK